MFQVQSTNKLQQFSVFRYICGKFAAKYHCNASSTLVKGAYELWIDTFFSPKVCCNTCSRTLRMGVTEGSHNSMLFVIWTIYETNKKKIEYSNISSGRKSVPRISCTPPVLTNYGEMADVEDTHSELTL